LGSPPVPDRDTQPLAHLLHLFGRDPGDTVVIAREGRTQAFRADSYPIAIADLTVSAFTGQQLNVWYEINPSSSPGRTEAKDVTRLAALYADIDFKEKPKGMGSLPGAQDLMQVLSGALGIDPVAVLHSGHGLQAYWLVEDGHIDEFNGTDMKNLSLRWGLLCKEMARVEGGGVDSIFDLARIFRAPGSVNWKDPEHPVPTSITWGHGDPAGHALSVAEINEVLDAYGIRHPDTAELAGEVVAPSSQWGWADHDCEHIDDVMGNPRTANPASRHGWLIQQATLLTGCIRYGCITYTTFTTLRAAIETRMQELVAAGDNKRPYNSYEVESAFRRALLNVQTMPQQRLEEDMRRHPHGAQLYLVEAAQSQFDSGVSKVRISETLQPVETAVDGNNVIQLRPRPAPVELTREFAFTDASNADRLAIALDQRYIHVRGIGWHRWHRGRYVPDDSGSIMEQAKESLLAFRGAYPADDGVYGWVKKSLSAGGIRASVSLAETLPGVTVATYELDANPHELVVPDRIINLRTGASRVAMPGEDMNTQSCAVAPERMPTPQWDAFLRFAIGDDERIAYMQKLFGTTLLGEVRFHILPLLVGVGKNGKSSLLEIVGAILGTYTRIMGEGFLIESHGERHPEEIARLRGARFAIATEVKANARFNEARVKMLTGESRLTGRFMGMNSFDFDNTVTLWLAVNHLPAVSAGGDGFWRRVRKIDFNNKLTEEGIVEGLPQRIVRDEGPGILQWMIDGAVDVLTHGLHDPQSVKVATKQYSIEEDSLQRFVDQHIVVDERAGAIKDQVYKRYRNFAIDAGIPILSASVFARELRQYVDINPNTTTGTYYGGIALALIASPDSGFGRPPVNVDLPAFDIADLNRADING